MRGGAMVMSWVVLAALLGPAAGAPALADEPAPPAEETYLDPVVRDVVRMLGEGVAPATIEQWLKSGSARPRRLSADDLIALSAAGAPESLTRLMVELTVGAPAPSTRPAEPLPATPSTESPRPRPRPAPAPPADGLHGVRFEVQYKAVERTEGEQPLPSRDLYVYLDGELLGTVESRADVGGDPSFETFRRLAAGRHLVRLGRERHEAKNPRKDPRPLHESTISPDIIEFVVEPASDQLVSIRWSDGAIGSERPLSWSQTRDGQKVAGLERGGVAKDRWPTVCDDIDLNVERGLTSAGRARRERKGCVPWSSLWPAGLGAPSRAELLDAISAAGTP